jgi:phenylacetate-coenzyme A ligase PaaK-like adenylate-forming protein
LWRKILINKYIRPYKIFRELRKNLWLKTSELKEIQEEKLKTLLTHAYQNVPFYRRLFDSVGLKPEDIKDSEDLYKIPTITKSQIKNNKKDMIDCLDYQITHSKDDINVCIRDRHIACP